MILNKNCRNNNFRNFGDLLLDVLRVKRFVTFNEEDDYISKEIRDFSWSFSQLLCKI